MGGMKPRPLFLAASISCVTAGGCVSTGTTVAKDGSKSSSQGTVDVDIFGKKTIINGNVYMVQPETLRSGVARAANAETDGLSLRLRALARGRDASASEAPHVLQAGERLRTGDSMAFVVELNQPAWVYLVQLSGGARRLDVLFPHPQIGTPNPLAAAKPIQIPPDAWFGVDENDVGVEHVYVVASRREQTELRTALDRLQVAPSREGVAAAKASVVHLVADARPGCRGLVLGRPEASSQCPTMERGLVLRPQSGAPRAADGSPPISVEATTTPGDDTIVADFSFQHQP